MGPIAVTLSAPDLWGDAAQRYVGEALHRELAPAIHVDLHVYPMDAEFHLTAADSRFVPDASGQWRDASPRWDAVLTVLAPDKLRLSVGLPTLLAPDCGLTPDAARHQQVGAALRAALALAAPRVGGALLHAAALTHPTTAAAALFLGPSGAGKTTMTRRLPGWGVLADDTALVWQAEGRWWVTGTPLRGREGTPSQICPTPLVAAFVLAKNSALALSQLSKSELMASLLKRIFYYMPPDMNILEIAAGAARAIPGFTLASQREDDVADLVHHAVARHAPRL